MNGLSCLTDPWREDVVPFGTIPCAACPLAEQGSRVIWGEGNPSSDIWILIDNPGQREDRNRVPFVCGTRQTLHTTAEEFGFNEQSLYVTFVVRRRPIRKYPKEMERRLCMQNFHRQVSQGNPRIIMCMGDVALSALLGVESHVKDMRGQCHTWNERLLVATYHPLAIRRRPNLEGLWRSDWALLQELTAL